MFCLLLIFIGEIEKQSFAFGPSWLGLDVKYFPKKLTKRGCVINQQIAATIDKTYLMLVQKSEQTESSRGPFDLASGTKHVQIYS